MNYTYLLINYFTIIIPFLFSFHPKIQFYKHFKSFFGANLVAALIFILWDVIFTKKGVWSFNTDYTIGVNLFGLPIEEMLFFICIPFACIFTYHSINRFYNIQWKPKIEVIFTLSLASLLLLVGFINLAKSYTAFTFISTGLLLLLLKFIFKVDWLPKIYTIYLPLLIPFFIVNGLLTGTGLPTPIVMYNDAENLGIRIGTIPFEDVFYGFELILLNLFLYSNSPSKNETKTNKQYT